MDRTASALAWVAATSSPFFRCATSSRTARRSDRSKQKLTNIAMPSVMAMACAIGSHDASDGIVPHRAFTAAAVIGDAS
eukprot:1392336-Prymnesium_polylepis.2